jgi:hypothetical protein
MYLFLSQSSFSFNSVLKNKELAARYKRAEDRLECITMNRLTEQKKAELRLIAELTLDATLAAEQKLSKLATRTRTAPSLEAFSLSHHTFQEACITLRYLQVILLPL